MSWTVLLSGLELGVELALIALGMAWVMSILKFLNFAHGDLISLGAYATYWLRLQTHWPFALCVALSAVIVGIAGVLIERVAYRPLRQRRLSMFLCSVGVSLMLNAALGLSFGPQARVFDYTPPQFGLGGSVVSALDAALLLLLVVVLLGSAWMLQRTQVGAAIRAVSENAQAVALLGISVDGLVSLTFFISAALAAVCGSMLGLAGTLHPDMGFRYMIWAFAVIVLAGFGSIRGIAVTGLLTGILISATIAILHTYDYVNVVLFGLMTLMLVFLPEGVFGMRLRRV
jgi:branched-chain amino acid transport system permease protein